MDLKKLKETLVAAGIEVYRTRPNEIHIAERIRLHLMDSGVRITFATSPAVSFTVRAQRSDFPESATETEIFARLRETIGSEAVSRGYTETWSGETSVKDPIDDQRQLDVWYEITYSRPIAEAAAIEEVRWVLNLERYVAPST
jgi:hypothetical protein